MGITDDRVGAHLHERIDEIHPPLEHLLEEQNRTLALRRENEEGTHHVGRKLRPRTIVDLWNCTARIGLNARRLSEGHDDPITLDVEFDSESFEHTIHHPIMTTDRVVNRDAAARRGGQRQI